MSQPFNIFLTRLIRYFRKLDRITMIWYGVLIVAGILLIATFGFTVLNHDYYVAAANRQQKTIIQNPVSRGTISSSKQSLEGVIAVSTNLGTLAIDPTQSGSTTALLDFLGDAVMLEYCTNRSDTDCLEHIGNYIRSDTLASESGLTKAILKERVKDYIKMRMEAPIESVLVASNLDENTINRINALNNTALFFVVNNLYVNPTLVQDGNALAGELSEILGLKTENILSKFAIRKKQYLEIIRKMSIGTRDMVDDFLANNETSTLRLIQENTEKVSDSSEKGTIKKDTILQYAVYPFITIQDNLVRYYPEGSSMGQITGFVDSEGVGRYGIEGYFENELQGESPVQVITKDTSGRPIRDYATSGSLMIQNGMNITLTIDRNIQKELYGILENATKQFRADRGSIIVMDPKTGAVTAMVNYPSYDPNSFTEVYDMEPVLYSEYPNPQDNLFGIPLYVVDTTASGTLSTNIDGKRLKLREASDDEIRNFAIQKYKFKNGYGVESYQNHVISALYEPGSVFKAITVAIGLDTGEIKPTDTYYDKNYVELDLGGGVKQRIQNLAKTNCGGYHTYSNALNWSCNVGMINIIEKIGRTLFEKYVHDFGFGEKTNLTIDGEVSGRLPTSDQWSRLQFFTMSFGQGINMTMLQMAAAYSVIANGGIYMKPYIVESMTYPDGRVIDTVPTPLRRVIKEETSQTVTAMLVDGAENGFAAKGAVHGYVVAGKTGTSQIPYRGTYENIYFKQDIGHTITSYGGYAPAYNPKFVMIVRFERPRSSVYAEQTASVVFAEAANYMLNYYKIPKNQ